MQVPASYKLEDENKNLRQLISYLARGMHPIHFPRTTAEPACSEGLCGSRNDTKHVSVRILGTQSLGDHRRLLRMRSWQSLSRPG